MIIWLLKLPFRIVGGILKTVVGLLFKLPLIIGGAVLSALIWALLPIILIAVIIFVAIQALT